MQENQQRLMQAWVSKAENNLLDVQNNLPAVEDEPLHATFLHSVLVQTINGCVAHLGG